MGHSMGGKVALRYAADYSEDLAALVIEDMDCRVSKYADLAPEELERRRRFDRAFPSWEECRRALLTFGYEAQRVDGWPAETPPRVMPAASEGGVWSAINPYAQWLARRTVLASRDAYEALQRLAAVRACGRPDLAVHVFVAGAKGTVCKWDVFPGGIWDMESVLPGLVVSSFPDAGHSIHNGALSAYADRIEAIAAEVLRERAGPLPN